MGVVASSDSSLLLAWLSEDSNIHPSFCPLGPAIFLLLGSFYGIASFPARLRSIALVITLLLQCTCCFS